MRLLLDTCVWGGARVELERLGHDVTWAGEWPEDPGDEEILARAHRDERILVTLDKDFGELAIVKGTHHHGIIRLVNIAARRQAAICQRVLMQHGSELGAGAIVTAEAGRMRFRPAESAEE